MKQSLIILSLIAHCTLGYANSNSIFRLLPNGMHRADNIGFGFAAKGTLIQPGDRVSFVSTIYVSSNRESFVTNQVYRDVLVIAKQELPLGKEFEPMVTVRLALELNPQQYEDLRGFFARTNSHSLYLMSHPEVVDRVSISSADKLQIYHGTKVETVGTGTTYILVEPKLNSQKK